MITPWVREAKRCLFLALCCLGGGLLLAPAMAQPAEMPPIRVLTSEFPPYNYNYNGVLVGVSVDVVRAVLAEAGVQAEIESVPWARAYQRAQADANILIFSITRTVERESLFKWVGTIAPVDYSFFARKDRGLRLNSLDGARQFRIATAHDDVVDQLLDRLGFPHVEDVGGQGAYEQNVRKLLAGRVDLWGVATLPAIHFLQSADPQSRIERVGPISELDSEGMYIAFGAKTADDVVAHFRHALERVKRRDVDRQALRKYVPPR